MKKIFVALIVGLFLWGISGGVLAEETKILKSNKENGVVITVPELCPDIFMFKNPEIVQRQRFSNGNILMIGEAINESQTVKIVFMTIKKDTNDRYHWIALCAIYMDQSIDYYRDEEFYKTGNPSDNLTRTGTSMDYILAIQLLEKQEI